MALEREDAPSASALESLMRAAHSLKGAARIVGLEAAVRVAHALEDNFVAAQRGEFAIRTGHVDVMLRAVDLLARIAQLPEGEAVSWHETNEGVVVEVVAGLEGLRTGDGGGAGLGRGSPPLSRASPTRGEGTGSPARSLTSPTRGEGTGSRASVELAEPARPSPAEPRVASSARPAARPSRSSEPGAGRADRRRRPSAEAPGRVVRVSAESLSRLMGLAGESLVQARQLRPFFDALTALRSRQGAVIEALQALEDRRASDPSVAAELLARARDEAGRCIERLNREVEAFDDYARRGEDLAGRLHHEVLASRMRPMSEGVRGFPRMVREVARELGKQVRFEVRGESTGVDRDILEKLEAPLNHLIRNALDHAIEPPEERAARRQGPDRPGPPGGPPQRGDAPDHPDRRRPGGRPGPAPRQGRRQGAGHGGDGRPAERGRAARVPVPARLLDQGGRDRDLRPGGRARRGPGHGQVGRRRGPGRLAGRARGPGSRSSCRSRCRSSGPCWSGSPASPTPSR